MGIGAIRIRPLQVAIAHLESVKHTISAAHIHHAAGNRWCRCNPGPGLVIPDFAAIGSVKTIDMRVQRYHNHHAKIVGSGGQDGAIGGKLPLEAASEGIQGVKVTLHIPDKNPAVGNDGLDGIGEHHLIYKSRLE